MKDNLTEALVNEHHNTIEGLIRGVARRHALPVDEHDDFAGYVWVKLLEDEGRVLRQHEGRSVFTTYLYAVLANMAKDYQRKLKGRWRPSNAARRLGETAQNVERLIRRDGFEQNEVVRHLRDNLGKNTSPETVGRLAVQLPPRVQRSQVKQEALENLATTGGVEQGVRRQAARRNGEAVKNALIEVLAECEPEDRRLLRSRFIKGQTVATIARTNGLDQRQLYRRFQLCLGHLKSSLERRGINRDAVAPMLNSSSSHYDLRCSAAL